MITISDKYLIVQIAEKGAQLHSIKSNDGIEYLWQGDPKSWKRQAPVLFPFVGRLKDDQYQYQGVTYHQTQHGFARDEEFDVVNQSATAVTLKLSDNENIFHVFPFKFSLVIGYALNDGVLDVTYKVTNPSGDETLLYSLGAHPGFNVPVTNHGTFETAEVSAKPAKQFKRIKLVAPGPFSDLNHPIIIDMEKPFKLNHDMFKDDAVIFALDGIPLTVSVKEPESGHGVQVITTNNKYVGVWSPYPAQANLLCIEPWWGIADSLNSDGQLKHKAAMTRLAPGKTNHYKFSIKPF